MLHRAETRLRLTDCSAVVLLFLGRHCRMMIHVDLFDPVKQLQHRYQLELFGGDDTAHMEPRDISNPLLVLGQDYPA